MLSCKTFIVFCLTLTIFSCEMIGDVMALRDCFNNKEFNFDEVLKQDLQCVCEYGPLGKTCRFATKADTHFSGLRNADNIEVTWKDQSTTNDQIVRNRIAIRRVFSNANNTGYGKWRKLAAIRDQTPHATLKTYLFQMPLRNGTYELRLDNYLVSGNRTATSVLLGSPQKLQSFTQLLQGTQSTCYRNGAIVGGTGGALGSCILTLLLVVLIKKCRRRFIHRRPFKSGKVPQFFANPNFIEEDSTTIQLGSSDVQIDMTGAESQMCETNVNYHPESTKLLFDQRLIAITVAHGIVELCLDRAITVQPSTASETEEPVWTGSKIITTV